MKKLFFGGRQRIGTNVGNFMIDSEFGQLSIFTILKIIFLFVSTLISKPFAKSQNCYLDNCFAVRGYWQALRSF